MKAPPRQDEAKPRNRKSRNSGKSRHSRARKRGRSKYPNDKNTDGR